MRKVENFPNGDNTTASELKTAMECARRKREYIRLAVVRSLLLGIERKIVAEQFAVSIRAIQLWVTCFNERGVDGLLHRSAGGRPRKIHIEEVRDSLSPVLEDPSLADEVFWTGKKLHGYLEEKLKVEVGYSSVIRYLHELGYVLKFPRPWAQGPTKDEEERARFKREIEALRNRSDVEIWFGDECGVEGDPRPRQRWAIKGSTPKVAYFGSHLRRSVIGAVCPESGEFFSLVINYCDTEFFQVFLNEMAKTVPKKKDIEQYLVLDNATWHKAKTLNWHHFRPLYLPTYSPDLNPIERLWARLKADFFADFVTRDPHALMGRICDALRSFIEQPEKVASICAIAK
jgi:transposase